MIDFDTALERMLSISPMAGEETIPLEKCIGRVVAKGIRAPMSLPPFSKSAMDGFALQSGDPTSEYRILETVAAGDVPRYRVCPGTCVRIMTGAMIPEGADTVVRVEYTSEADGCMRIIQPESGTNIIEAGENIRSGDILFEPGIVAARHIGMFAEQGIDRLPVSIPPLIGIITTGSELTEPGETLPPGMIYNSNGPQLCAQVCAMGGRCRYTGRVADEPELLKRRLNETVDVCDVVILSGGVSMGEFDFVPPAVDAIGAEIVFHKVAVKPGKPILYARKGAKQIVGLPGNPVSTYVIFETMIKPMIYRLMGISVTPEMRRGRLTSGVERRDTERTEFRPVYVNDDKVVPARYGGSSHLSALGAANALLRIERGVAKIAQGTEVDVRPIQ